MLWFWCLVSDCGRTIWHRAILWRLSRVLLPHPRREGSMGCLGSRLRRPRGVLLHRCFLYNNAPKVSHQGLMSYAAVIVFGPPDPRT